MAVLTVLGAYERALVEFVLVWAPYGGPRDEDSITEFGMTPDRVIAAVDEIVNHVTTHRLSHRERQLLCRVAALSDA